MSCRKRDGDSSGPLMDNLVAMFVSLAEILELTERRGAVRMEVRCRSGRGDVVGYIHLSTFEGVEARLP